MQYFHQFQSRTSVRARQRTFELKKPLRQRETEAGIQIIPYNINSMLCECQRDEFCADLTNALVRTNIPINKLESEHFVSFLKKWTGQAVPSGNHLRYKQVSRLCDKVSESVCEAVGENDIAIMIDETTDRCERFQVNVLVSILNGARSKPMLLHVEFADRCDAVSIFKIFIKSCNLLWRTEDPPYERVKLDLRPGRIHVGRGPAYQESLLIGTTHKLLGSLPQSSGRMCARKPSSDRFIFTQIQGGVAVQPYPQAELSRDHQTSSAA